MDEGKAMGKRIILPTEAWLNDVKGKRKVVRPAKKEKAKKKVRLFQFVNFFSNHFVSVSHMQQVSQERGGVAQTCTLS